MGARKFVVFDIEAMGCLPMFVNQLKPVNSKCVDELNSMVLKFNEKLPLKLLELGHILPGSVFVVGKNYQHILNLVENPQEKGKLLKILYISYILRYIYFESKRTFIQPKTFF